MATTARRNGAIKRKRAQIFGFEIFGFEMLCTQIFGLTCNLVTPVGPRKVPALKDISTRRCSDSGT
jgi:hypothetical protein